MRRPATQSGSERHLKISRISRASLPSWRPLLEPSVAREVTDLTRRINDFQRVMNALLSRKNVLMRGGIKPNPTKPKAQVIVPKPRQSSLFE